jgi:cyanoexosortase B
MKVAVDQIYVSVDGRLVEVGAYCSGLKMLFNSFYLGIMLLYWSGAVASRKTTTAFLVGAVIISICASIFRNTLLIFFHGSGQESAFKWLHEEWGGHVYSAAILVLLVPLLNVIERYFSNAESQENL